MGDVVQFSARFTIRRGRRLHANMICRQYIGTSFMVAQIFALLSLEIVLRSLFTIYGQLS